MVGLSGLKLVFFLVIVIIIAIKMMRSNLDISKRLDVAQAAAYKSRLLIITEVRICRLFIELEHPSRTVIVKCG